MRFEKKLGDRIRLVDHPEFGEMTRVRLFIREGWNDHCPWHENEIGIEEARDIHYALGRLLELADR